ncbi:MAG: 4Fe-4S binding protein [Bacillus subtilis]|nr:4Fe-4S binding protein [Bacillus subtilis]
MTGLFAAMRIGKFAENHNQKIVDYQAQLNNLRSGPFGKKTRIGLAKLQEACRCSLKPEFHRKTKSLRASRKRVHLVKPKAIIECYEDIPCNPCETSCPFGAIEIGPDINQQPRLIVEKCTGCSICVTSCPGLAIIVAQSDGVAGRLKLPYEFLPRPRQGRNVARGQSRRRNHRRLHD